MKILVANIELYQAGRACKMKALAEPTTVAIDEVFFHAMTR